MKGEPRSCGTTRTLDCEGASLLHDHQCCLALRLLEVYLFFLSVFRKNIMYQVQVVSGEIMESATAAADALDEALKLKKKERDDAIATSLSTALIVSPQLVDSAASTVSLYKNFLPETLMQRSWIVTTPMSVASNLASRLFGSQSEPGTPGNGGDTNGGGGENGPSTHHDSAQAKSLLEELNGLNMQLLERLVRI